MTDAILMLHVVLQENTREDDCEATIAAIKQLRGVVGVEKQVDDPMALAATWRAKSELINKLWSVLK